MIHPRLPKHDYSLLIRTDFSDDRAWDEVCRAVQEPQTPDEFQASVECISDEACAGLAPEAVAALLPPGSRRPFVFLADARACQTPDHPVLVVDLLDEPGRTFRVVAACQGTPRFPQLGDTQIPAL